MSGGSAHTASCQCGAVKIAVTGSPIAAVTCHCDDCQEAAQQLGSRNPSISLTDAYGGTPYVLFPADRARVVTGGELLEKHKLRPESHTNREVASCCGTAMMADFDRGPFWVSIYQGRFEGWSPKMEMRVQTRFAPHDVALPGSPPAHERYSRMLMVRIAAAGAAKSLRSLFGSRAG